MGSKGAERNTDAIKNADVIIFPAVQEFLYFAEAMHPRDVEKSQVEIRKTYEHLNDKHIILLIPLLDFRVIKILILFIGDLIRVKLLVVKSLETKD